MTADENIVSSLYKAITNSVADGNSPSVRELAISIGVKSTSTVHKYLEILESRGAIVRNAGAKRNISLPGASAKMIPIIGVAAAGAPILAHQQYLGFIPYGGIFLRLRSQVKA